MTEQTNDTPMDRAPESVMGRRSKCAYYGQRCKVEVDSDPSLPFFKHRPDAPYDTHYCGCRGWD